MEHYTVTSGDNWYPIARKLTPVGCTDAQIGTLAATLAQRNGFTLAVPAPFGMVLHYDPTDIPVPPEPEPPATDAVWLEVEPGAGNNTNQRRIVVPVDDQYPNAAGVTFELNGVTNRTDTTGRRDGSEFHTFPAVDLAPGDVLRASWVDEHGIDRSSAHQVPAVGEPPAEVPSGDWPTPQTTGPTSPTTSTQGPTTISTPGVYENIHFTGQITVTADDVTIRNCVIEGGQYGVYNGVFTGSPTRNLVIENCEITGQDSSGVAASNAAITGCHIHHQGADAVKPFSNVLMEGCYVSHLGSNEGAHSDGVQMVNGSGVTVRGNNFEQDTTGSQPGYNNSQVMIIQSNNGPVDDVLIEGNRINGGGFSVQVKDKGNGYGFPSNVRLINNVFGRGYRFGPLATNGTLTENSGNVYEDDGSPI